MIFHISEESGIERYAGRQTTMADRERFLGSGAAVVAVEGGWLKRLRSCRLVLLSPAGVDIRAHRRVRGLFFVSRVPVVPAEVHVIDDALSEFRRRGVELRMVPNLWPLRDAVVVSSLQFSMIRMRNALPRSAA